MATGLHLRVAHGHQTHQSSSTAPESQLLVAVAGSSTRPWMSTPPSCLLVTPETGGPPQVGSNSSWGAQTSFEVRSRIGARALAEIKRCKPS